MANNIKHVDSLKYQKALTANDRVSLDKIISSNRDKDGSLIISLKDIALMLEKDPTTLSKEVKLRRGIINTAIPKYKIKSFYCKMCDKTKTCKIKDENKYSQEFCSSFVRMICKYQKKFPWVCNGCPKRGQCTMPKTYYSPLAAQNSYEYTLSDSRIGIYMKLDEYKKINEIISNGLKKKQSIEHILHSNDISISTSTAYNYLHKGYFNADVLDTHRISYFRGLDGSKPYNSKVLQKEKFGRHYEDFTKLIIQNPDITYSQMDTVEGTKGGKVILSLKVVKVQFQFYFLLQDKSASSVVNKLNEIQKVIGIEDYKKIFGYILTDNGTEFSNISGIITDPETKEIRTDVYFCHPQCSGEKGSCERNHELFRYILPKGTSFNQYDQIQINRITSHVNSLKRKSTEFSTPIELFYAHYGHEILNKLGISLIEPNSVMLSNELVK